MRPSGRRHISHQNMIQTLVIGSIILYCVTEYSQITMSSKTIIKKNHYCSVGVVAKWHHTKCRLFESCLDKVKPDLVVGTINALYVYVRNWNNGKQMDSTHLHDYPFIMRKAQWLSKLI